VKTPKLRKTSRHTDSAWRNNRERVGIKAVARDVKDQLKELNTK
jgi:hypothetical protein